MIPTKEITIYLNNKMHITKDVKHVMNLRKIVFKKKDKIINLPRKRDKEENTRDEDGS